MVANRIKLSQEIWNICPKKLTVNIFSAMYARSAVPSEIPFAIFDLYKNYHVPKLY